MGEDEAIVNVLEAGDGNSDSAVIRDHVAVQGEKFHHLITNLKPAAE